MPGIVRLNDKCSGHDCYPPRSCITASTNVFIEKLPLHRKSDKWALHDCPDLPPHDGVTAGGSSRVYANSLPVARVGDYISCGSYVAQGSLTVFAG